MNTTNDTTQNDESRYTRAQALLADLVDDGCNRLNLRAVHHGTDYCEVTNGHAQRAEVTLESGHTVVKLPGEWVFTS